MVSNVGLNAPHVTEPQKFAMNQKYVNANVTFHVKMEENVRAMENVNVKMVTKDQLVKSYQDMEKAHAWPDLV